jgi:chemotaxis protein MotA
MPAKDTIFSFGKDFRISYASIAGAVFGIVLIVGAILMGTRNYLAFISIEGFMIVVGGTFAIAFMSYQANYVIEALQGIILMFRKADITHENLHRDITDILDWARIVRAAGMRGLESHVEYSGINDPFVRYGLDMVVSNYNPEEVRAMLETAADAFYERGVISARVLMSMASHSPAFGMVGTLIGMVIMLGHFKGDMSGIGTGMAISLLATLYGIVTARMIYIPASSKIFQKQDELRFRNHLIIEGLVLLVDNRPPGYIQDRLNSFLKPGLHQRHSKGPVAP